MNDATAATMTLGGAQLNYSKFYRMTTDDNLGPDSISTMEANQSTLRLSGMPPSLHLAPYMAGGDDGSHLVVDYLRLIHSLALQSQLTLMTKLAQ